jgi:citrate synthase
LLGAGSVVLGSAEAAGRLLFELVQAGGDAKSAALECVRAMRAAKTPIPGFGHPQHSGGDPRADLLLRLAAERGLDGPYIRMLNILAEIMPEAIGRTLPVNINGVIPAILLEIGFPVTALKSISILARTAGLLAHLQEETERPIGFIMSHAAAEAITYDGRRKTD